MPGVVSACAAAVLLGRSERTIRRAIRRGELAAVKRGRAFQITLEALEEYRAQCASEEARQLRAPVLIALARPGQERLAILPAPLTSFIGRVQETAAVAALLRRDDVRLVTLMGPGGVGKTRLAIRVAGELIPDFPAGVAFVSLADIRSPSLVLSTIARALGVRESAERPLATALATALRDRRMLLVLDNFEHLAGEAAAGDLAGLLEACPLLTVLATSRASLQMQEERRFQTPPLALPEVGETPDIDRLSAQSAIALFVDRARQVKPGFALDDDNASVVLDICRRLEGLPLALELAAAWLGVLSPRALRDHLQQRLPMLTGGAVDQPPRLRTMRDAIAWSHDLLDPEERRLFRRLGVFVGGFTLEAAERVTSATRHLPPTTLDLLTGLLDKSLLQSMDAQGAEPRFAMLETVREFACERLAETREEADIHDRHAMWCLAFAERAELELMGTQQAIWFDWLEAEHANLRAALAWFQARGDAERGLRLACALAWFWSSRSNFREARTWLDTFLAMPTTALMRGHGLVEAANIWHWQGDTEQATAYAAEALAICQAHGDRLYTMQALRRLASLAIDEQDFARAAALLAESGALARSIGNAWDAAFAIYLSGRLAVAAGKNEEAVGLFAESAEAFRAINDRGYVAAARGQQGAALLGIGDLAGAAGAYAESLDLACETRDQVWVAWALVGAAHLTHSAGESAAAARLLGAATEIREAIGEGRLPHSVLTDELRSTLGDDRFASEWSHGVNAPAAQAITEARAIFADGHRRPRSLARSPSPRQSTLTPRERDVLRLLAAGRSDKQIADALIITRRTASQHVSAILGKLGVHSRAAAVAVAARTDLA